MNAIKLEKQFNAPIGDVWHALTQPELMEKWYFKVHNFSLEEDSVFTFYGDEETKKYLHRCQVMTVTPLHIFEHTWEHPNESKGKSVVRWELNAIDENTTNLVLTHSGTQSFSDAGPAFTVENYEFGWEGIVGISLRNFLHHIEQLTFKIEINLKPQALWDKLWSKAGYAKLVSPYMPGGYFEGNLLTGEEIRFLSPDGNGFVSDVLFARTYEQITFSHQARIENFEEMELTKEDEFWTGILETYRLTASGKTGTQLIVQLDCTAANVPCMNEFIPKGLQAFKEFCETEK